MHLSAVAMKQQQQQTEPLLLLLKWPIPLYVISLLEIALWLYRLHLLVTGAA